MSTTPSTQITRLREKQDTSRDSLDELLDSTPLATVALVRDGHPVVFPTGFARIGDEFVIHGSTGSPWLRALASGAPAAVSVTTLDGVVVARSGFESSFRYRSATEPMIKAAATIVRALNFSPAKIVPSTMATIGFT